MRRKQKLWITSVLTILFVLVVGVCVKSSVFGRFIPEEPYVTDAPMGTSSSLTTVTNEGGNQKGSMGSGATPMEGVPPAATNKPKGDKENPFVLLEIVPEQAQQQMVYLNTSDENYPLDVMQIGIDASAKKANFHDQKQSIGNYNEITALGYWFYEYQYDLYEYGEDEQTIKKPLVEIDELYSMKMEPDFLKEKGINVQEFDNYFNQGDKCYDVKSLSEKYPALFQEDGSGEEIRDIALEDNRNWDAKREKKGAVHFDVSFSTDEMNTDKDYRNYVNVPEIIRENPHIFKTDNNGNEINDAVREDINNWKGEYNKKTDSYDYRVLTKSITKDDYNAYQNKEITIKDLISRYSGVFQTDFYGKKIEKSRLNANGWKLEKLDDEKFPTILDSGYLHYVGSGGNYTFSTEQKWNNSINDSVLVLEKKENGEWEYFEDLPDNAKKGDAYWQFDQNPQNQELYWSVPMVAQGYGPSRKVVLLEEVDENEGVYVFTYKRDISHYEFTYDGGETHAVYSFKYYGLKTNDVLKRSLFTFQDEEECKNFNLRVIAMTPSEINKAVQGDTSETLDIIERADMFYIASYNKKTDNIKQVYELYNKYIAKKDGYVYSEDNIKCFYENDLDWGSCYKILDRLSKNANLPLMWTLDVGNMINDGVDGTENTHMYVTEDKTANHIEKEGSLNNLAKLYLITIQFDLLARKGEGEIEYKRTFSEDILPNLQTIQLNSNAMKKAEKDTASTTGYYERKLVETDCKDGTVLTDDAKKTCYYLWNLWTFYPSDIKLADGLDKVQSNDVYVQYGYLDSFFDLTSSVDVFRGFVAEHHSGSDGYDGKNVGVVHGHDNAMTNFSTLIGSSGEDKNDVVTTTMNVAYQIMNKQTPKIEPLEVRVEKRKKDYQKLSNELILIDYNKKADYDIAGKEPLYIKLKITNTNNEDAILKSVKLLKDEADSDTITLVPRKTKEESTKMTKEMIRDVNGQQPVEGYRIPANGSLTFYVPYQISEYKQDYTTLQLVTQARKFLIRKGKKESTLGRPAEHTVTISERTLFNLE